MKKESTTKMVFDWIKAKGLGHEFTASDVRAETRVPISPLSASANQLVKWRNILPVARRKNGLGGKACILYRVVDLTPPKRFRPGMIDGVTRHRPQGLRHNMDVYNSLPVQDEADKPKPNGRKRVEIEKPSVKPLSERLFELAIEVEAMERGGRNE
jgi:hypothetical protein